MKANHPTDLLPAFALGCLDPDENSQVAEHLRRCAACRAELQALEEVSVHLAYAVPSIEPSETVKKNLLATCCSQRSFAWFETLFSRWPRLIPITAMASCVLAVVFTTSSFLLLKDVNVSQPVTIADLQLVPLQGAEVMPQAIGQLVVDTTSGQGRLLVNALQPLAKSLQYQLWLIRDGQRTSGGVFSVSQNGTADVLISSAWPLAHYDSVGITIEPYGGSLSPTGQKVLGGRMLL